MFATVEFYEGERTLKGRIKSFFFKEKIISERVELPENEYFYRLKVPVHKGTIPEERLKRITESLTDGLIFPRDFRNFTGIKEWSPSYFKDILLFNTAVSQIEKSVFNPAQTLITLIDKKGVLHSSVSRLVPFSGELKIITDNVRAYERESERIMSEYGLSLFVSNRLSDIPEKGIVISARSDIIPVYYKGLIITGEKRLFPFARVLSGEGIKEKGAYGRFCPEGIDMTDFLSAVCEVCFAGELRRCEYEKLVDISI